MRKGDEVDDKVGVGADECVACGGSFAAVPEWRLLNVVATQMDVTIEGQRYQTQVADEEVALVNDFLGFLVILCGKGTILSDSTVLRRGKSYR